MNDYAVNIHMNNHVNLCIANNIRVNTDELTLVIRCIHTPTEYKFYILDNMFLPNCIKMSVSNMFCSLRKIKQYFKRCIYNRRYHKLTICNDSDLSCIPFSEYKESEYFELVDKGQKYRFKHSDMYNIIESSLTNSNYSMISTPVAIKNPYTGVPFSNNVLYLLYTKLEHVSPLFVYFMKCEFNLDEFLLTYECLLRTYIIHKTLRELTVEKKREEIIAMLHSITIIDYETSVFVPIMHPSDVQNLLSLEHLLLSYYNYQYSLNPYQRSIEYKKLIKQLLKLREKIDAIIIIS